MTGRSMLRCTADGKVEDKTRMEEEESSLLDSLLEEACRSTNGSFVGAFFCQKTQCVLSISTKIHTFPPEEFCRLHPEPEPESVLCGPYCVLKWFKVCNLKNRIKPKSISVQSSVFLCSWSSTTEQRWRDIMRRPLWLGIFVMQRHIDRRIFFSLCAQKKVIRDKLLHGVLLALQKYENLALPNKILTHKLTSGSWKDFPGNLFLIMY